VEVGLHLAPRNSNCMPTHRILVVLVIEMQCCF
jgi:hypothetical protein